jgi:xanthosine utilization system XapX-like protein
MRILAWLATVVPSAAAGISVGHVVASLDAPAPVPFASALVVGLIALHVLDTLISSSQAANRG